MLGIDFIKVCAFFGDYMDRIINVLKYFVLGMVQGVSEMLPISSSGHMKITETLFNIGNNDLSLEIFFHLASLAALLLFFGPTLKNLIVNNCLFVFKNKREYKGDFRYLIQLIVATIPAAIIGLILKDKIESFFSNVTYIGISLLVTSLFLFITSKCKEKNEKITYGKSFIIGLFQGLALIPGISRSGSTYMIAKKMGVSSDDTSQFIFLMLIPITLGSFILSLPDIMNTVSLNNIIPCIVGLISSFIFTYLSLSLFNKVIKNAQHFSVYCFLVGILTLIFL